MAVSNIVNNGTTPRVNAVVGATQLRKYGKFIVQYVERLEEIQTRLAEFDVHIHGNEPVLIKVIGEDPVNVLDIINTDNKILNKIVTVMAALCIEVRERVTEAQEFYNDLLVFGDDIDPGGTSALIAVSKFLPRLQDLANFIERCQTVVVEFLQQLAAVYTISPKERIINAENMHFEDMMQHLGDLLAILVNLDSLVASLDPVHETWTLFKRIITTVHLPDGLERIKNLTKAVNHLEQVVLSGGIFRGTINRLTNWNPVKSSLPDELQLYLKNMLTSLDSKEQTLIQDSSVLFLRTSCIYVLTTLVFGLHDKKIMKQIWDVARRIPCVPLAGSCVWHPDQFFSQHMSHLLKSDDQKQIAGLPILRNEKLAQFCKNTVQELGKHSRDVCLWTIELDMLLLQENTNLSLEDLRKRCSVFLDGAKLAGKMKRSVRLLMSEHAAEGKPMTRSTVLYLCGLTELISAIGNAYHKHHVQLAESAHHVAEYLTHGALGVLRRAKKRLSVDKSCTRKHLDALSALLLAHSALKGPTTSRRLLVARLALSVARGSSTRVLREEEVDELYTLIQQLDQLACLQQTVSYACDTSHLYHQRVLLPVYLDQAEDTRTPYVLSSLSDIAHNVPKEKASEIVSSFESSVMDQITNGPLRRTQETVETSLRLQVHAHLSRESINQDVTAIRLAPVRFFDKVISIKSHVEAYLDKTFYNLTTVALHDWRSYGEMRALAQVQMGLSLIKDSLPCQTLEQGLDILEVIRNISVFVAGYQYNMNNQLFVERESGSKHLNTIGIRHVSNSIRTHGTGIVNTSVNFIFQFLRNKFYIFSQFLFDEQIKSRLAKDAMVWREAHARGEESYPYERAVKFVKGIRKLGMTDGLSYLDQFRTLITHIGNAMGYVRLVRSGGMHACSNSLSFLPEIDGKFIDRCGDLSAQTKESAKSLDQITEALAANFADGTHYFRMLVDVFAADFRNPKHGHLNNFYMIVPPLTISFIDHMLANKDKVARKKGTVWTDDGFAMGLTYVLTLLGQHEAFGSLHWFTSIRNEMTRESQPQEAVGAASLLAARRVGAYRQEYELLAFNLNSAKIFFKKQVGKEELK